MNWALILTPLIQAGETLVVPFLQQLALAELQTLQTQLQTAIATHPQNTATK